MNVELMTERTYSNEQYPFSLGESNYESNEQRKGVINKTKIVVKF